MRVCSLFILSISMLGSCLSHLVSDSNDNSKAGAQTQATQLEEILFLLD